MMTTERKAELFDNAILWIFEHTEGYGIEEYARALENIGCTEEEISEQLNLCSVCENLKYKTVKEIFRDWENKQEKLPMSERTHLTAYITFTSDSFTTQFSEKERTYVVSSDNKAFRPNCVGYSIFGTNLDGADVNVRLEGYMAEERGGASGWKVEKCVIV